ncbi:19359_t:CDS:2 [Dentiscutata erythropus]|uniref:19359_t:CDS:1 n=1 Tax=Dentiscutata erythropus TaxID=1348616 RepID=A0A9N8WMR7_9GLOM|nr:19359_t:CDS:2 [Dentiscutata erythropus]
MKECVAILTREEFYPILDGYEPSEQAFVDIAISILLELSLFDLRKKIGYNDLVLEAFFLPH